MCASQVRELNQRVAKGEGGHKRGERTLLVCGTFFLEEKAAAAHLSKACDEHNLGINSTLIIWINIIIMLNSVQQSTGGRLLLLLTRDFFPLFLLAFQKGELCVRFERRVYSVRLLLACV